MNLARRPERQFGSGSGKSDQARPKKCHQAAEWNFLDRASMIASSLFTTQAPAETEGDAIRLLGIDVPEAGLPICVAGCTDIRKIDAA